MLTVLTAEGVNIVNSVLTVLTGCLQGVNIVNCTDVNRVLTGC